MNTKNIINRSLGALLNNFGLPDKIPKELTAAYAKIYTQILDKKNYQPIRLNESFVVAPNGEEKIAALFYDRVWGVATHSEIGFSCGTDSEIAHIINSVLKITSYAKDDEYLSEKIPWLSDHLESIENHNKVILGIRILKTLHGGKGIPVNKLHEIVERSSFPIWIADQASQVLGTRVTPLLSSHSDQELRYKQGDKQVAVAVMSNIDIISGSNLSWEQVIEARKDSASIVSLRRFVHWLDSSMIGQPVSYIEDEVSIRLEDYQYALKKHGINTAKGVISNVLEWKNLASVASVATGATMLSNEALLGATAGAGILIGKVAVHVIDRKLSLEEVKRGANREVAFIHELTKK